MDSHQNFKRTPTGVTDSAAQKNSSTTNSSRPTGIDAINQRSSETLQPLGNSQSVNQPMHQPIRRAQPTRNQVREERPKTPWWVFSIAGVIGYLVMKSFSPGGTKLPAPVSHEESEASKMQPWPAQLKKEFTEGCIPEVRDAWKKSVLFSSMNPTQLNEAATNWCNCMQKNVEDSHLIKTKFETSSYSAITAELKQAVQAYMDSGSGQSAAKSCMSTVK
jgi:hypothetical protein